MSLTTTLTFSETVKITINHPKNISDESIDMTYASIWPSSILLSLYLKSILPQNSSQTILEFGAGLGLIAQFIRQYFPLTRLILQELPDESIVSSLAQNIASHELVNIISGRWGDDALHRKLFEYKQIELLVMSDCFYCKKTFPFLLSSISFALNNLNIYIVICVYHHRNVNDSIIKYLDVFDLCAEIKDFSPEFNQSLYDFKDLNPKFSSGTLLNFKDLFIIEFKKKTY